MNHSSIDSLHVEARLQKLIYQSSETLRKQLSNGIIKSQLEIQRYPKMP